MAIPDPTPPQSPAPQQPKGAARRERTRVAAAAIIGAIVAAFALLNLGDVKVNWLVSTGQTPLIVVIVVAFALGMAIDRLLLVRAKRKRRSESESEPG